MTEGERQLTVGEIEILELVALGLTNAQIGGRFGIAGTTVTFHLSRIFRKLGVSSRSAAAAWLREQRVVAPSGRG